MGHPNGESPGGRIGGCDLQCGTAELVSPGWPRTSVFLSTGGRQGVLLPSLLEPRAVRSVVSGLHRKQIKDANKRDIYAGSCP